MTDQPLIQEPRPPVLHSIEPAAVIDNKDYTLRNPSDVLGVLRALQSRAALMTAYFNQGADFMMTALLKVIPETNTLILDVGSDTEVNRRALASERLIVVSNLDKVKIQFVLRGIRSLQYENRPAFSADIPATLIRLQRREFYRFVMPVLHPLLCNVPLKTYDGTEKFAEASIVDISGGGVGLIAKPEALPLASDLLLPDCRIDLPGIGHILATLRVRSVFDITLRSGAQHKRAGCQFVDLPGPMQMLLQRFIIKAERERKARESGLG
jgi:c-di-GMP-binding flagellar brake protein YcgR